METKNMLRKITKHVWDFILYKVKCAPLPIVKYFPGVNIKMIHNLFMSIWVETYVSLWKWRDFMYRNFARMNLSNRLYANYVIYACHIEIKYYSDPCERFVHLLALVIQMALYSSEDRQVELLEYSREICIKVFEIEIQEEFYENGGWKNLNHYLQKAKPIEQFKTLENLEKERKFPQQIVTEMEFDTGTQNPISEHFSQGINTAEIENHPPTIEILKSIDSVLESIRLMFSSPKQDSSETSKDATSACLSENQEFKKPLPPKDKTRGGESSKDLLERRRLPPARRVSTRQTYLRAKRMLKVLLDEFDLLLELLDCVYLA